MLSLTIFSSSLFNSKSKELEVFVKDHNISEIYHLAAILSAKGEASDEGMQQECQM